MNVSAMSDEDFQFLLHHAYQGQDERIDVAFEHLGRFCKEGKYRHRKEFIRLLMSPDDDPGPSEGHIRTFLQRAAAVVGQLDPPEPSKIDSKTLYQEIKEKCVASLSPPFFALFSHFPHSVMRNLATQQGENAARRIDTALRSLPRNGDDLHAFARALFQG